MRKVIQLFFYPCCCHVSLPSLVFCFDSSSINIFSNPFSTPRRRVLLNVVYVGPTTHMSHCHLWLLPRHSRRKTPKGFQFKIKSSLMFIRRGHRLLSVSFDSNKHYAREIWEFFIRELNSICRFQNSHSNETQRIHALREPYGKDGGIEHLDSIKIRTLFHFWSCSLSFSFFLLRYTLHETRNIYWHRLNHIGKSSIAAKLFFWLKKKNQISFETISSKQKLNPTKNFTMSAENKRNLVLFQKFTLVCVLDDP